MDSQTAYDNCLSDEDVEVSDRVPSTFQSLKLIDSEALASAQVSSHPSIEQQTHGVKHVAGKGGDDRVLLLFDLNGVLVKKDMTPSKRTQHVRPGLGHLISLLPHFRLGVYTSATPPTATAAMATIAASFTATETDHLASMGYQTPTSPGRPIFEVVLTRDACRPDPSRHKRRDGKDWDTVKPIGDNGMDLSRTVLIDDSVRKILEHEVSCVLLVEPWDMDVLEHPDDILDGVMPFVRVLCTLLLEAFVHNKPVNPDARFVLPIVLTNLQNAQRGSFCPSLLHVKHASHEAARAYREENCHLPEPMPEVKENKPIAPDPSKAKVKPVQLSIRKAEVLQSLEIFGLHQHMAIFDEHAPPDPESPKVVAPMSPVVTKLEPPASVPPVPCGDLLLKSLGGDGTVEQEALVGRKLLELCLFKRLFNKSVGKGESALTNDSSTVVSDAVLAAIGLSFVVPKHLTAKAWKGLNTRDKAACVCATIGRKFLKSESGTSTGVEMVIAQDLVLYVESILSAASGRDDVEDLQQDAIATEEYRAQLEKFLSADSRQHASVSMVLFEWLQQHYQLGKPAQAMTVEAVPEDHPQFKPKTPQFIGHFYLETGSSGPGNAPKVIAMDGPLAQSKKVARDSLARIILIYFGANPQSNLFQQI